MVFFYALCEKKHTRCFFQQVRHQGKELSVIQNQTQTDFLSEEFNSLPLKESIVSLSLKQAQKDTRDSSGPLQPQQQN